MISETIIMKKTIKYIAALAAILCSVSCSLDEKSFTEIEKDEYMNSPKEAQNVLLGVYKSPGRRDVWNEPLTLLHPRNR